MNPLLLTNKPVGSILTLGEVNALFEAARTGSSAVEKVKRLEENSGRVDDNETFVCFTTDELPRYSCFDITTAIPNSVTAIECATVGSDAVNKRGVVLPATNGGELIKAGSYFTARLIGTHRPQPIRKRDTATLIGEDKAPGCQNFPCGTGNYANGYALHFGGTGLIALTETVPISDSDYDGDPNADLSIGSADLGHCWWVVKASGPSAFLVKLTEDIDKLDTDADTVSYGSCAVVDTFGDFESDLKYGPDGGALDDSSGQYKILAYNATSANMVSGDYGFAIPTLYGTYYLIATAGGGESSIVGYGKVTTTVLGRCTTVLGTGQIQKLKFDTDPDTNVTTTSNDGSPVDVISVSCYPLSVGEFVLYYKLSAGKLLVFPLPTNPTLIELTAPLAIGGVSLCKKVRSSHTSGALEPFGDEYTIFDTFNQFAGDTGYRGFALLPNDLCDDITFGACGIFELLWLQHSAMFVEAEITNTSTGACTTDNFFQGQDPGTVTFAPSTTLFNQTRVGAKFIGAFDDVAGVIRLLNCQTAAGAIAFELSDDRTVGAPPQVADITLLAYFGTQQDTLDPAFSGTAQVNLGDGLFHNAKGGDNGIALLDSTTGLYNAIYIEDNQSSTGFAFFTTSADRTSGDEAVTATINLKLGVGNSAATSVWYRDGWYPNAKSGAKGGAVWNKTDSRWEVMISDQQALALRGQLNKLAHDDTTIDIDEVWGSTPFPFSQVPDSPTIEQRYELCSRVDGKEFLGVWDETEGKFILTQITHESIDVIIDLKKELGSSKHEIQKKVAVVSVCLEGYRDESDAIVDTAVWKQAIDFAVQDVVTNVYDGDTAIFEDTIPIYVLGVGTPDTGITVITIDDCPDA